MRSKTFNDKNRPPINRLSLRDPAPPSEGEGLRLAIYQGQGQVGDRKSIEYNLGQLKQWARAAAKFNVQLLALPELFLCGYNILSKDVDNVVMRVDDVVDLIAPIARNNGMAIICPYAEKAIIGGESRTYDAMIMVDDQGCLMRNYRKTHLWGEDEKTNWWFGYGEDPENAYQVQKVNGINVGLLNCYEAEFPELSRILALEGAQVIVIPTAADVGTLEANGQWSDWGYPDVSKTAIPGNAYQNKLFVAYANHALYENRSDGSLSAVYLGNSAIADPYGELLVAATNVETLLVADCVPGMYFPTHPDGQSSYIKDRRPHLYSKLVAMEATLPDGSTINYPEDPNTDRSSGIK